MELPTDWTRKLLNLAGIASVNDKSDFALRFQWQFNHVSDTGRVDNIRVLSGAVTGPSPAMSLSRTSIERTVQAGQSLPNDIFHVSNTGEGILNFSVSDDAAWLSASPPAGSSPGPPRVVAIAYNVPGLGVGDYQGAIRVASMEASNWPQMVTVKLHVIPPACFWEPFEYYDGNLTTMGYANWSGSATNQLQVEKGVLRIPGGGGAVSASHAVGCGGSNGVIGAQIKIRKGTGSGDFFWNIAFDDPGGNNVARWYGGSTIARGRVGSDITADMNLTSTATWDDLYIKIDTAANTSEFFFNGISFRVIPHGTASSNTVGSIRIERLDRASAANDSIDFDNLTLGAPDTTPPKLKLSRSGNNLMLSWPATGAGTRLQSTLSLNPSIVWSAVSGATVTNGEATYTTTSGSGNRFYRLWKP